MESDKEKLVDRLLQLRSLGRSFNDCAAILGSEGFRSAWDTAYTSQRLAVIAKTFEDPLSPVNFDKDFENQSRLSLRLLQVGSRQVGWGGDLCKEMLRAYIASMKEGLGRRKALEAAKAAGVAMRSSRRGPGTKSRKNAG